jgi:ABC-2 type transport system ATP-binding protein
MATQIEVSGLSFRYSRHRTRALTDVTCTIAPGITGIIGPNGAGKTTLFRLLLGTLEPSEGRIVIDGSTPSGFRRTGQMGFIPDHPAFPATQTVGSFLYGLCALHNEPCALPERLREVESRMLTTLSLGESRLVEWFAASINHPSVMLLDEPTNGLDPSAVAVLRNDLKAINDGSRVIIIASHHLDELQRVADCVIVLDRGQIVGTVAANAPTSNSPLTLEEAYHAFTRTGGYQT